MKSSFRFANRLFFLALLAGMFASAAAAQQNASLGSAEPVGSRSVVFNTTHQCELIDIPDAPARAFRDDKGMIHMVSSHYRLRQSIGPTLATVKHRCEIAYDSHHDPNPANWDDSTWVDSFFSIDGKNVVGLGHMEYHGWEHPGECFEQGNYSSECWYNGDTFHMSHDGGYHFNSFTPPANYILSLPFPYLVNSGPEGYSIDTNIIKSGDWYYAIATGWNWPVGCGDFSSCFVHGGASPIRTNNITDPKSWRGWSGGDFSVQFTDPYAGPVVDPLDHVFTPVPIIDYANSISYHPASGLFVATLIDPFNQAYGPEGIYLSTSPNLVSWSQPVLVVTIDKLLTHEPPGNWTYAYASLLDDTSTDPNFSTIGDTPYLYYVRSDNNNCCYVRVLYRQKIKLTWTPRETK